MSNTNFVLHSKVTREGINKLPTTTGVYFFKNRGETVYIGKSVNLKARLLSHLENAKCDTKEASIVSESNKIRCIVTDTELNALLLESQLIQKYKPRYNSRWRDDKSSLYIKITLSDEYPKISAARKEHEPGSRYFGPFASVSSVEDLLNETRKIFPFCTQRVISKSPCFYSKIGLCNPCPNIAEKVEDPLVKLRLKKNYRKNIRDIIRLLEGKTGKILNDLYKSLRKLASQKKYEEAIKVRDRIRNFESLLHRRLSAPGIIRSYNASSESVQNLLQLLNDFFSDLSKLHRMECIDISNFSHRQATASLVVFSDGLINKKEYRRFKIKDLTLKSDFEMMSEVMMRRFKQKWEIPDLLVVDGGKPQVRTALQVLRKLNISSPIIGIAKHPDRIIIGIDSLPTIRPSIHDLGFNLVRHIRDESHRFARKYHVLLRYKSMTYE